VSKELLDLTEAMSRDLGSSLRADR
jgi:hypothetical protein